MTPPAVIITGASGGIGFAMVQAFEHEGWRVVTTDQAPIERPLHVTANLSCLSDPEGAEARALLDSLRQATAGSLKAVIANAAHQVVRPCSALDPTDWDRTLSVNVLAPFWLTMGLLDELTANRGCLLAISSIHEKLTKPGFVAYATSKAALSGMVRALAVDLEGRVRCNAICPAAVATPMLKAGFAGRPDAFRQLEHHHPSGRVGEPAEVAALALFMCSERAGFMNGACVDLSGGISARLHDPV